MKIIGIIPARYGSTRFEGKPLAMIDGKTMIQRVVEQAKKAETLADVIVATDDDRIAKHILDLGEKVVMTSSTHQSGTDRCAEVMRLLKERFDAIINIQGDEPFMDPSQINALTLLMAKSEVQIATLAIKLKDNATLFDPNKVKVTIAKNGQALYFSRHAIPYLRNVKVENWNTHFSYYKHIGLYAYKTEVLKKLSALPQSPLEMAESLEQLRWLENGYRIHVAITDIETPAVDTPEDLKNIIANM